MCNFFKNLNFFRNLVTKYQNYTQIVHRGWHQEVFLYSLCVCLLSVHFTKMFKSCARSSQIQLDIFYLQEDFLRENDKFMILEKYCLFVRLVAKRYSSNGLTKTVSVLIVFCQSSLTYFLIFFKRQYFISQQVFNLTK